MREGRSGRWFLAKVNRQATVLVVEHRDQFEPRAERLELVPKHRHRALGDL
jgi:hypothetical protein